MLQENQLCDDDDDDEMTSRQNKKQVLACKESETEFESSKQCHLRQLQQLKKKLLALQQELEFRTEELQTSYCSLLQYQSILEKETCDLVQLHHHCKLKEDEVILYEEEMGSQEEENTGKKLRIAQEQLTLAGDKIASLERSLSLYKDKYQTSLSNIELLECQVKMLEGELNGIVVQNPENKGDHPNVRMCSVPSVNQDNQETLKRLSDVWQKVAEQDDLIQDLRNKLACSNALVLEREESLIKLQADFVSYQATHRHPPCSSGDCEDMKKILKYLQEQKDSQCLQVAEYQNLVKGLKMELDVVSEQKKNIMKDMMKLELELHMLREEMAAQLERKEEETADLQHQLQEMEWQFCELRKFACEKDKVRPGAVGWEPPGTGTFSPNAETPHVPTRSKFQSIQFADIEQSNSGDVPEGLDDTIVFVVDNAGSPALDPLTVPHFALARSHSLRCIDRLDIIPGLKFLKKQNCLFGLLVAFYFVFDHQRKFRNFLNTMTFRHDEGGQGRGSQGRTDGVALLNCVHSPMPTAPGFGWCKHAASTTHISKSTLARAVGPTTPDSRNSRHGSASAPRLSTGLMTCQFTESIGLPVVLEQALQEKMTALHKLDSEAVKTAETRQPIAEPASNGDNCEALRTEVQNLKTSLEEAKQKKKLAAEQAAQYKEQASQTEAKLEETQMKLQHYISLDKQKSETIQELQSSLQKQREELARTKDQLASYRKQADELTFELSETKKLLDIANKEKNRLQNTVRELEMNLQDTQERLKQIEHQMKEQTAIKDNLEDELQELQRQLEEKREQLKKSKEQEKMLEQELESSRQEGRKKEKTYKENLRKLEEENENLRADLLRYSTQLDAAVTKYNSAQQTIEELNTEIAQQKELIKDLRAKLDKAIQKEREAIQNMVSKDAYEELARRATTCQEDLTRALEKLNHAAAETKELHRSLMQTQERKTQLEDEITAYEERMRKLNLELKKLQGFHQQSELEVHVFDKKLEEMTSQVLQWQKQHKSDLKMLAAKEEQLMGFQVEMAALKKKFLEDDKPCCIPQAEGLRSTPRSVAKDNCRLHRENDQIMANMEQWAKEQKIANEKLGSKLREQVKYIAKLTGEKDHLHNVMVHLQQENKKLKNEIEEKKLNVGQPKLYSKPLNFLSRMEPRERKACGAMGWRGLAQDLSPKVDNKLVGMPHYSGRFSYCSSLPCVPSVPK
ncbi:polyamine-modulated factor 1-binding protein 1 [Tenrec ecaudatus]|uniref:polyamine-modulated factor 1-binding protein 1 n=1 Tax=Tenrec ecaudatus TaxID=94439 RepID=UPI003F5A24EA